MKDKFKEMEASLKIQEQTTEAILKKNIAFIENYFKKIRDAPRNIVDDTDKWLKQAKEKLDKFALNSSDPNYIAYDMLESKNPQPVGEEYNLKQDIIAAGEKILTLLENSKDISDKKADQLVN